MLTFLHISDTHISADPEYRPHRPRQPVQHPNRGVESLLEAIGGLSFPVDFILHTGDVCAERRRRIIIGRGKCLTDWSSLCYCCRATMIRLR